MAVVLGDLVKMNGSKQPLMWSFWGVAVIALAELGVCASEAFGGEILSRSSTCGFLGIAELWTETSCAWRQLCKCRHW
jgi:hypothetical protein